MDYSHGQQSIGRSTDAEIIPEGPEIVRVTPKGTRETPSPPSSTGGKHGVVEMVGEVDEEQTEQEEDLEPAEQGRGEKRGFLVNIKLKRKGWGQYIRTKEFWIVLVLGQVLALALTGQNTFTELLVIEGTNIPAFQSFFNYVLLNIIYTSYTLYRYGFKGWCKMVVTDGWKYFLLAFVDVEGNYFVVLAYDYTTILSCTLLDFWAIAVVMLISLIFLKVRYHLFQYIGILVCLGGMGILLGSDHITGTNQYAASDALKGDLFMLLGATFYGLSNVFEEFFVSKKPMYEVVGQLGFWGMLINGVQCGIFDRSAFQKAHWNGAVGGYLTGFTILLTFFYSLAPIVFRLSSAAFFNISLLTSDFWSVIVGIQRFHLHVHWMYPIAFVCIVLGLLVYFITEGVMGDSFKPWLGSEQEGGVDGVGTAKRRLARQGDTTDSLPTGHVV